MGENICKSYQIRVSYSEYIKNNFNATTIRQPNQKKSIRKKKYKNVKGNNIKQKNYCGSLKIYIYIYMYIYIYFL